MSLALVMVLALSSVLGCGSADYDAKYEESLETQRRLTPFVSLWEESVSDAEVGIGIRLPKLFNRSNGAGLDSSSPDPIDKEMKTELDPYRAVPFFLELPGYRRTYETFVRLKKPNSKKYLNESIYCYLALLDRTTPEGKIEADALEKKLLQQFLDTEEFGILGRKEKPRAREDAAGDGLVGVDEWVDAMIPTPEGKMLHARKLVASGKQYFHRTVKKDDAVSYRFSQGKVLLYLISTDKYYAIVGWRAPVNLSAHLDIDTLADASVGTLLLGEDVEEFNPL